LDSDFSRRRFLGLTAAGTAALVLAACGDDDESTSSNATTASTGPTKDFGGKTITTAVYSKNHASAPLYWQQFAPPGLTVKPVIVTSAGDVSRALASGELDFGLMGPFNTVIEASTTGIQSRIIGMCARQGIGLIARKDRGIAGIADLKGKKVAVPPPGMQTLLLTSALDRAGMKLGTAVTPIPLAFADHPGALERGDVDAYIGTEPLCTKSVVAGVGTRIGGIYDSPAGDFNTAIWASPKNLGDPDLLLAVTSMQRDSAELLTPKGTNDASEWHQLLVDQFGYTEPEYQAVLENIGAEWRFDQRRRSQVEGAADLMLAQGVITSKPRIDDLLLLDYQPRS